MHIAISKFQHSKPRYESTQEASMEWIASAHAKAESLINPTPDENFFASIKEKLDKIGLGHKKIKKRGLEFDDFFHLNWDEMKVFNLHESPQGRSFKDRSSVYDDIVTKKFEEFYPQVAKGPDHLIHVTCTGYVAPSGAQKICSKRGFESTVTNAYHMGCYGALPAIRMGKGFLHSNQEEKHVDIVHTELCSLHMNPALHSSDQLVVQTLFGDGCIKYTLSPEDEVTGPYFKLRSHYEKLLPDTEEKMTWLADSWGMRMTISRDIPLIISKVISSYLERLMVGDNVDRKKALFAIHPGGPKIITQIAEFLNLEAFQIFHSQKILENRGNMSSATLPHIWEEILLDPNIENGTSIISLAFGPGLSISGNILEKKERRL